MLLRLRQSRSVERRPKSLRMSSTTTTMLRLPQAKLHPRMLKQCVLISLVATYIEDFSIRRRTKRRSPRPRRSPGGSQRPRTFLRITRSRTLPKTLPQYVQNTPDPVLSSENEKLPQSGKGKAKETTIRKAQTSTPTTTKSADASSTTPSNSAGKVSQVSRVLTLVRLLN